jgi:Uma2 family endonuclease
MNWQEVCEHPDLHNLPFKIELDEKGRIIMSPVRVYHSAYQAEISYLLRSLAKEGKALAECAIKTRLGTKVTDVAWASAERFVLVKEEVECSIAPEVCVEVLSASNTEDEINIKKELYFENGAKEVWICYQTGCVTFYNRSGEIDKSEIFPAFPKKIEM